MKAESVSSSLVKMINLKYLRKVPEKCLKKYSEVFFWVYTNGMLAFAGTKLGGNGEELFTQEKKLVGNFLRGERCQ